MSTSLCIGKSAVFPGNKTENNTHTRSPPKKYLLAICFARLAELFIWDQMHPCFWKIGTTIEILVLHQQEVWNYGVDKIEQLGWVSACISALTEIKQKMPIPQRHSQLKEGENYRWNKEMLREHAGGSGFLHQSLGMQQIFLPQYACLHC